MEPWIEKLHRALVLASPEWEWNLLCVPQAGQQRIKITARDIVKPEICRTMIFTKALCKALPAPELAMHIRKRLHLLLTEDPTHRSKPVATFRKKPVRKSNTLRTHYEMMLHCYKMALAYMKFQASFSDSQINALTNSFAAESGGAHFRDKSAF